jgi:hypothetical protein
LHALSWPAIIPVFLGTSVVCLSGWMEPAPTTPTIGAAGAYLIQPGEDLPKVIDREVPVSRLDTVRDRTAKTKKRTAKKARKQIAPRAASMRGSAADRMGPPLESAREAVGPRLESARAAVGPRLESAKAAMGPKLGSARDKMKTDLLPKVAEGATAAVAASGPVRHEARSRGAATLAAMKGDLTTKDMRKMKRRDRRARGRKVMLVIGVAGGAAAAWSWWRKRNAEPDWDAEAYSPSAPVRATSADAPPSWATAGETLSADPGAATAAGSADLAGASPEEMMSDAAQTRDNFSDRPGRVRPGR